MPAPSARCSRAGFTLIELLVVISIIALLIGILLSALGAARATARALACGSSIRQITLATMTYTNNFKEYIPASPNGGTAPVISYDDLISSYDGRTLPTAVINKLFVQTSDVDSSFYKCPSDDSESPFSFGTPPAPVQIRSYSISRGTDNPNNTFLTGISGNVVGATPHKAWSVRLSEVRESPTTIALAENRSRNASGAAQNLVGNHTDSEVTPFALESFPERLEQHDGRGNFSYLDGHVSLQTFADTEAPTPPPSGYRGSQWDWRR